MHGSPLTRRAFLAAAGLGLVALAAAPAWAHHKPGHGPAPTTTTTTTLPPGGGYSDTYADAY